MQLDFAKKVWFAAGKRRHLHEIQILWANHTAFHRWFLACQSWMSSISSMNYIIHPASVTTRLPNEEADVTFSGECFPERSIWTPSRYSLSIIRLAQAICISIDLKLEHKRRPLPARDIKSQIDQAFTQMVQLLPASMSIDASDLDLPNDPQDIVAGAIVRSSMERWLFHQQLFHIYLELQHHGAEFVSRRTAFDTALITFHPTPSSPCLRPWLIWRSVFLWWDTDKAANAPWSTIWSVYQKKILLTEFVYYANLTLCFGSQNQ